MIKERISRLLDDISLICQRLGRDSSEVTLVAVTKFATSQSVRQALEAGVVHIAESKVQEAKRKFIGLNSDGRQVIRHMIGHLQTNKAKSAVELFDCIQSVDSFKLAKSIDEYAAKNNKEMNILIQVNTAQEEQKFGIAEGEAEGLIEEVLNLEYLRVEGLMTIGPWSEDQAIVRESFRKLRVLKERLEGTYKNDPKCTMKYLSMGMSSDYHLALEEGSNMVRIGGAIFHET